MKNMEKILSFEHVTKGLLDTITVIGWKQKMCQLQRQGVHFFFKLYFKYECAYRKQLRKGILSHRWVTLQ